MTTFFSGYKCKCVRDDPKGQEKGVVKWCWLGGGYGSNDKQSSDRFRIIFDFYYFVSSILYLFPSLLHCRFYVFSLFCKKNSYINNSRFLQKKKNQSHRQHKDLRMASRRNFAKKIRRLQW